MRDRMWILATVWFSELGCRFFTGGSRCGEESQGPRAEVLQRNRKQDVVGASKNRDTEGQGCLTRMDNTMGDEFPLSLSRVKT